MKVTSVVLLLLFSGLWFGTDRTTADEHNCTPKQHTEWVTESLVQIRLVHAGMVRRDLLRLFEPAPGVSSRWHRTYMYRECNLFKVYVEFSEATPAGEDKKTDDMDDRITQISKPYLDWTVRD